MSHCSGFPFVTSVIAYAPSAQFEYTEVVIQMLVSYSDLSSKFYVYPYNIN